jgi:hypothetical protein
MQKSVEKSCSEVASRLPSGAFLLSPLSPPSVPLVKVPPVRQFVNTCVGKGRPGSSAPPSGPTGPSYRGSEVRQETLHESSGPQPRDAYRR